MLNLAEYRRKAASLADYLPWAALVAPGIVLNKDGSFQRTIRYRGPDLESATEAELVSVSARINNVLRRFGSGWHCFSRPSEFQRTTIRPGNSPIRCRGWSTRSGARSSARRVRTTKPVLFDVPLSPAARERAPCGTLLL